MWDQRKEWLGKSLPLSAVNTYHFKDKLKTLLCNIGGMRLIPIPTLAGSFWCLGFNCSDDAQSRWWAKLLVLCRGLGPTAAYGTTSVWFLQDQINKEDCFVGINGEDTAASMIQITCKCSQSLRTQIRPQSEVWHAEKNILMQPWTPHLLYLRKVTTLLKITHILASP